MDGHQDLPGLSGTKEGYRVDIGVSIRHSTFGIRHSSPCHADIALTKYRRPDFEGTPSFRAGAPVTN